MAKITLSDGDITKYSGDALIVPCDSELTFYKGSQRLTKLLEVAGEDLLKELSAIGYCEIGNAVITKGHNLKVKHLIFLPYKEHSSPENIIDNVLFHQALRSSFTLAQIYGVKSLAISLIHYKEQKDRLKRLVRSVFMENKNEPMTYEQIMDIVVGVQKEQANSAIKYITIYK